MYILKSATFFKNLNSENASDIIGGNPIGKVDDFILLKMSAIDLISSYHWTNPKKCSKCGNKRNGTKTTEYVLGQ